MHVGFTSGKSWLKGFNLPCGLWFEYQRHVWSNMKGELQRILRLHYVVNFLLKSINYDTNGFIRLQARSWF